MSSDLSCDIVILAAGKGTRMRSRLPKVLQIIGDKPLLTHLLATVKQLKPSKIVIVYGEDSKAITEAFPEDSLLFIKQSPALGTGHALLQALPLLSASRVLVLCGDAPLVSLKTLEQFLAQVSSDALGVLSTTLNNPTGFGRIKRDNKTGQVTAIIEELDASMEERALTEINTGILLAPLVKLKSWLPKLSNKNAKEEYYLTDIFAMARAEHFDLQAVPALDPLEVRGINTPQDLEQAERYYQQLQAEALLSKGVRLRDKNRIDIRGTLNCETDVTIDINALFEGVNNLGAGVSIGPNCVIKNCTIAAGASILAFSHLEGAIIGAGAKVGPFARLRSGTKLKAHSKAGNFVELKNTTLGEHSKVNHLSYLGDATIGAKVNIGAGTITCNYDGANKHRTVIEDEVFIGSASQLIAPLTIGQGATIGAGTTVLKDVPARELVVNAKTQKIVSGWKRPEKNSETKAKKTKKEGA